MDTVLRLGDFEFSNLEIPESLILGGVQVLARHRFPGGAKNVQALGPEHAPITFGGTFLGAAALDRARALDFMRTQGAPLKLTAFEFTYTVVIERYQFVVERFYKVPYIITLEVVSDDSQLFFPASVVHSYDDYRGYRTSVRAKNSSPESTVVP